MGVATNSPKPQLSIVISAHRPCKMCIKILLSTHKAAFYTKLEPKFADWIKT